MIVLSLTDGQPPTTSLTDVQDTNYHVAWCDNEMFGFVLLLKL
jgi:hypothetical protein